MRYKEERTLLRNHNLVRLDYHHIVDNLRSSHGTENEIRPMKQFTFIFVGLPDMKNRSPGLYAAPDQKNEKTDENPEPKLEPVS